jgi:hypothetical protein
LCATKPQPFHSFKGRHRALIELVERRKALRMESVYEISHLTHATPLTLPRRRLKSMVEPFPEVGQHLGKSEDKGSLFVEEPINCTSEGKLTIFSERYSQIPRGVDTRQRGFPEVQVRLRVGTRNRVMSGTG